MRLVVLQAHAELDVAGAGAAALGGLEAAAAVALRVELDEVLELGEPELEDALAAVGGGRGGDGGEDDGGREEGEGDGSRGHLDGVSSGKRRQIERSIGRVTTDCKWRNEWD